MDFLEIIRQRRETRGVEYKASQPFPSLAEKIAKTAMAMSNLQDGGCIVIGLAERGGGFSPDGMRPDDANTYSQDTVQEYVNRFAQPYVDLAVYEVADDERLFIVIDVRQFQSVPTICARDSAELRHGAIYVRSGRKNETAEIRTADEMRDIIEMATEKRLAAFLGTMERAGVSLERLRTAVARERFEEELEGH